MDHLQVKDWDPSSHGANASLSGADGLGWLWKYEAEG